MKALIFTDPHLTDDPKEEYRWACFRYARDLSRRLRVKEFVILGDLTDKKDNHSASLVTRMVSEVVELSHLGRVHILKGNHDYVDANKPFFGFLGELPNVSYYPRVTNPTDIDPPFLWLPHTFDPIKDWAFVDLDVPRKAVFLHQTLDGSLVSNGVRIETKASAALFEHCDCPVLSGDVHVPQKLGRVTYIGSPHPVKFGDDYKARMVLMNGKRLSSYRVPTIKRCHARITRARELHKLRLREGDHVKVTVELTHKDVPNWTKIRDEVRRTADVLRVELFNITAKLPVRRVRLLKETKHSTSEAFSHYCVEKKLPSTVVDIGREIMKDA